MVFRKNREGKVSSITNRSLVASLGLFSWRVGHVQVVIRSIEYKLRNVPPLSYARNFILSLLPISEQIFQLWYLPRSRPKNYRTNPTVLERRNQYNTPFARETRSQFFECVIYHKIMVTTYSIFQINGTPLLRFFIPSYTSAEILSLWLPLEQILDRCRPMRYFFSIRARRSNKFRFTVSHLQLETSMVRRCTQSKRNGVKSAHATTL